MKVSIIKSPVRKSIAISTKAALSMVILGAGLYTSTAYCEQNQDLMLLQKTTYRLIDLLVEEGVLSADKAEAMKREAENDAGKELAKTDRQNIIEPDAVRVTYVPEFVRDEIKEDLRKEMKADVLASVAEQASRERWGMPGAWPEWIERIKFSGDVRVRGQSDSFGDGNFENSYVDVRAGWWEPVLLLVYHLEWQ